MIDRNCDVTDPGAGPIKKPTEEEQTPVTPEQETEEPKTDD